MFFCRIFLSYCPDGNQVDNVYFYSFFFFLFQRAINKTGRQNYFVRKKVYLLAEQKLSVPAAYEKGN